MLLGISAAAACAQTVVPLWNGPAPQSNGNADKDIPSLTIFLPERAGSPTPAVLICPGGSYAALSFQNEGTNVAGYFQHRGVAAFVLKYRLPKNGYRRPIPLLDAQRAVRLVRASSGEWNIAPAKVGVIGFSAGGHLASTLETHFDAGDLSAVDATDRLSCRPDFALLVYPVISMKDGITHKGSKQNLLGPNPDPTLVENLSSDEQVTSQTTPTVLVYAENDRTVPPKNSQLMFAALQKAGIPSALQSYPQGNHGFGYGAKPDRSPQGWLDRAYDWLKTQGFMPQGL